ncbi:unnamed protein product, partial [Rotaria magnacalcarata]
VRTLSTQQAKEGIGGGRYNIFAIFSIVMLYFWKKQRNG